LRLLNESVGRREEKGKFEKGSLASIDSYTDVRKGKKKRKKKQNGGGGREKDGRDAEKRVKRKLGQLQTDETSFL